MLLNGGCDFGRVACRRHRGVFGATEGSTAAQAHVKAIVSGYLEKLGINLAVQLLADHVEHVPATRGLFMADLETATHGTLLFSTDPRD